jgi:hypothetical protein
MCKRRKVDANKASHLAFLERGAAWYPSLYAPRAGGAYDSHHQTAGIAGCTRRRNDVVARRARAAGGDAGDWLPLHRPDNRRVSCAVFVEGENVAIECRFAAIVSGATEEERQCAKLQSQPYWLHSE